MGEHVWTVWWAWVVAGFVLGIIEVFAPGFVFLGFAIGAILTGAIVATGMVGGLPPLLLVFAVLSLAGWLLLRHWFGRRPGQVKLWDRDINDDP